MSESITQRQNRICKLLEPALEDILNVLHEEAISGSISAAKTLLSYFTPPPRDHLDLLNLPELAIVPAEQRLDTIFIMTSRGEIDLDNAERLAKMATMKMRQEETARFITFLRRVADGADPVAVARELAKGLENETKYELLQ